MPGTTIFGCRARAPGAARAISRGEQTSPSRPAATASSASRSACAPGARRHAGGREIGLVEAGQHGHAQEPGPARCGRRRGHRRLQHRPPAGRMQRSASRRPAAPPARTAPATVFGMSCSLRSRKIGSPSAATASTPRGPWAVKNSSPSLMPPTCGASAWASARVPSRSGRSTAQKIGLAKAGTKADGSGKAAAYSRGARACQSRRYRASRFEPATGAVLLRSGGASGHRHPPLTAGRHRSS